MSRKILPLLAAALSLAVLPAAADATKAGRHHAVRHHAAKHRTITGANLVVDPSFEAATNKPGDYLPVYPGETTIPGWEVVSATTLTDPGHNGYGSSVDVLQQYPSIGASDGAISIDLDGWMPGAIRQSVPTEPGAQYALTFDLSTNPAFDQTRTVQVDAGPATTTLTKGTGTFEARTLAFTATSTSSTIQFTSLDQPVDGLWCLACAGPVVDNVSVVKTVDAPVADTTCKAAPAIVNEVLKANGLKPTSALGDQIIKATAANTGRGKLFGNDPCRSGYRDGVLLWLSVTYHLS